jgi:hypothetical protein
VRAHILWFFAEGDSADPCASSRPGLDLNDNFAAQFLRSRDSLFGICRGLTARDLKSIRSEDRFALILV